jgi:hypothetical protein
LYRVCFGLQTKSVVTPSIGASTSARRKVFTRQGASEQVRPKSGQRLGREGFRQLVAGSKISVEQLPRKVLEPTAT